MQLNVHHCDTIQIERVVVAEPNDDSYKNGLKVTRLTFRDDDGKALLEMSVFATVEHVDPELRLP